MIPYYVLNNFKFGPLTLHTWGVFAGLAFAAALFLALREAKRKGFSEEQVYDLAILVLAGGILGARGAFVIENWQIYSQNLYSIIKFNEGGLMLYGGLVGAFFAAAIYVKIKKLPFWKTADMLVPSLAAGEFIGRIGCVLGDLHIGSVTALPWGQEYIDGSVRHPISIYMALNGAIMLIFAWRSRRRFKTDGALFLFLLLWYSGIRFLLDFLRCADLDICDPHHAGFTPSQYISAFIFLSALILIIKRKEFSRSLASVATGIFSDTRKAVIYSVSYLAKKFGVRIKFMEDDKKEEGTENVLPVDQTADSVAGEISEPVSVEEVPATEQKKESVLGSTKNKATIAGIFIVGLLLGAGGLFGYYQNMFKASVFSFQGKTWTSSSDPIVNLIVVNDKNCEQCNVDDMLKQMKTNAVPTMVIKDVAFDSVDGKALLAKFEAKSLPALIFDSNIEKTEIYKQISNVLVNKDGKYYINPSTSGIPQGKLLQKPVISDQDRVSGPANAAVTILEFSDFQCPYCKVASETLKQVLAAYPKDVRLVYREFPLRDIHKDAQYAAEAAECAGDQGKFFEMHDAIFADQTKLDKDSIAKDAGNLKLDMAKFNECLASGKFKAKIDADVKSGTDFGVSGTPALFIGDRFVSGGSKIEDLKSLIDGLLKAK